MSRGVATILGLLLLVAGGLALYAAFTSTNPVTLLKQGGGTFSAAGGSGNGTVNSNASTGTSGGGGQFTSKTQ